jgi:hypothetical protein
MYRTLRNTHLLLGLFGLAPLVMYSISALQMAHDTWFPSLRPAVTQRALKLDREIGSARTLATLLMREHGMRGELRNARETSTGYELEIARPGTHFTVAYDRATGEARVKTARGTTLGLLNRLHHLAGFWHGDLALNAWGALVAFISVALIVLGLTGIYLWFTIHSERLAGGILLAATLAFSLTLLVAIRMA